MRNPDLWRRIMLDRATAMDQEPRVTVLEFAALIREPPTSIHAADARLLAKDYPQFSLEQIRDAFTLKGF
jgi:hypothetical protein